MQLEYKIINFLKKYKYHILGLLLFFISPILSIPILFYLSFYKENNNRLLIILLSLSFAYIAFHTQSGPTDDLQRHFDVINKMKYATFLDFYKWGYNFVWVNSFIMYIVHILGNNSLYPFFLTLIGYYIIIDICYFYHKKNNNFFYGIVIFVYVFFMTFFKVYVLSLRNYVAFLIAIYTLHLLYQYKISRKCFYFVSVIAFFIHPSSIVITIFYIAQKRIRGHLELLFLGIVLFHRIIFQIIHYTILKYFNFYLFDKLYIYLIDMDNQYNLNMCILFVFTVIFLLIIDYFNKKNTGQSNKYLIYSCVLSLSTIYQFEVFRRFMYIVIIFSIPSIFLFFKEINIWKICNRNYKLNNLFSFVLIIIIIGAILSNIASIKSYGWYFDVTYLELLIPILIYL